MEEHTHKCQIMSNTIEHTLAFINMQWPFVLQVYHVIHMELGEKTASRFPSAFERPMIANLLY